LSLFTREGKPVTIWQIFTPPGPLLFIKSDSPNCG
jgi:hypothetical protein